MVQGNIPLYLKNIWTAYKKCNPNSIILNSDSCAPKLAKYFPFINENQKLFSFPHKIFNIFAWLSYRSHTRLMPYETFGPPFGLFANFVHAPQAGRKFWSGIRRRW